MFRRALARATAQLFRQPRSLIVPNLQLTALLCIGVPAYAALQVSQGSHWVALPSRALLLLLAWLGLNWLAYCCRRGLEDPRFTPGFASALAWVRARSLERGLTFLVLAAVLFWAGLAFSFYRAMIANHWAALPAAALMLLMILMFLPAVLLNAVLASRLQKDVKAEWKTAILMALAFMPYCLAALVLTVAACGAFVVISGTEHWWGKLFWVPVMFLPLFSMAWLTTWWTALSDEFLAKSLGREAPAFDPFDFKELMRPWR